MCEIDVSKCEDYNDFDKTCNNYSTEDKPYCNPKELKCPYYIHYIEKQLQQLKQENEELRENIKQLTEWKRKTVTCQECYDEGLEDGKLKLQQENKELKDKLLLADRIAKDILKVFEIDEYDIYADQNEIIDKIKEYKLILDRPKTIRRNK